MKSFNYLNQYLNYKTTKKNNIKYNDLFNYEQIYYH